MADFRFIHTADVHLDSPLRGLSRYEGLPVDEVRGATRAAFDNLVEVTLAEAVDFLLIAGDLFDGDWKDMGTGLYFARAMGRLDAAGIPVFLLAGNHDAGSVLTRTIPWPSNVRRFGSRMAETHVLEDVGVAVHGHSFANAAVTDNLASGYPAAVPHHFNIGMLHTSLAGHPGHERYAPCSINDLLARGYDYWALGHVHDYQLLCEEPPIVFPGNTQGRSIRETGPKGAVLVEVRDRQVAAMRRIELNVLRWSWAIADCADLTDLDAVRSAMHGALAAAHAEGDGRPVVARLLLKGRTPLAGELADRRDLLRDEARALAAGISPELWLEKIALELEWPTDKGGAYVDDDFLSILAEASTDEELIAELERDLAPFLTATAAAATEDGELRLVASLKDWTGLLKAASKALGARLSVTSADR